MPFFKAADKLIYYAHVPKCGGSAIAHYLQSRFGRLGFYDRSYQRSQEQGRAWSKTSPQHIDLEALRFLLPMSFFDAAFAVVRHPVPRTVSTYHFQQEVEGRIPADMSFSDWLSGLEREGFARFDYDNHVLPMTQLVPEGAEVIHLEHGLDALVHWLDANVGNTDGARVIPRENSRGDHVKVSTEKVTPSAEDIACIARIYAADFERFGYVPGEKAPQTPPPDLSADAVAARNAAFQSIKPPTRSLGKRLSQGISRRLRRP